MVNKTSIYLIGPTGAGKSSIGNCLAKQLNKKFYDSDQEIVARTGVNIAWIFDVEGESGFRQRETTIIDELTALKNIVLATGGGVILNSQNRKNLAENGLVIYLNVSLDEQLKRIEHDNVRPLLQNQARRQTLLSLKQQREAYYQEIADVTISTDGKTPQTVAQEILRYLEKSAGSRK